jgi:hypothetical protein
MCAVCLTVQIFSVLVLFLLMKEKLNDGQRFKNYGLHKLQKTQLKGLISDFLIVTCYVICYNIGETYHALEIYEKWKS